ncbi:hypothetical protein G9A89_020865 [Geosiphon pyriformis]|nr:hypothetical protein G9A89_020865 [Geosiphon pyriformis]
MDCKNAFSFPMTEASNEVLKGEPLKIDLKNSEIFENLNMASMLNCLQVERQRYRYSAHPWIDIEMWLFSEARDYFRLTAANKKQMAIFDILIQHFFRQAQNLKELKYFGGNIQLHPGEIFKNITHFEISSSQNHSYLLETLPNGCHEIKHLRFKSAASDIRITDYHQSEEYWSDIEQITNFIRAQKRLTSIALETWIKSDPKVLIANLIGTQYQLQALRIRFVRLSNLTSKVCRALISFTNLRHLDQSRTYLRLN